MTHDFLLLPLSWVISQLSATGSWKNVFLVPARVWRQWLMHRPMPMLQSVSAGMKSGTSALAQAAMTPSFFGVRSLYVVRFRMELPTCCMNWREVFGPASFGSSARYEM